MAGTSSMLRAISIRSSTETEAAERQQQAEDAQSGQRRRYDWVFDPYMDIFQADPDGGHLLRLTDAPGYDAEGAYSPDGKLIAFCSTRDGDPDLYVMNADGSNVRQITNDAGLRRRAVHFARRQVDRLSQRSQAERDAANPLHRHRRPERRGADRQRRRQLGALLAPDEALHHLDRRRPLRPDEAAELRSVADEVRGARRQAGAPGDIERITDHPTADVLPVFSPDGNRLMWTSNRTAGNNSQLWTAEFKLAE